MDQRSGASIEGGQGAADASDLEAELARTRAELERLRDERAVLTDLVLHDVRGILASLRWTFELLRREHGETGLVGQADSATSELLRVLAEFAAANRLSSRYLDLSRAPSLVRERVDAVVGRARTSASAAEVELVLENELPDRPLLTNAPVVERMLGHLIANAIEASGPGGHVVVRAAASDARGGMRLVVEDDGPGVAPEQVERIFDPYYSRWGDGERGVGLGLAMCRLAARLLGGSIEHAARAPRGSIFVVELPTL